MYIGLSRWMQMQIRLPVVFGSVRFMQMTMMVWPCGRLFLLSKSLVPGSTCCAVGSWVRWLAVAVFIFVPRSIWFDILSRYLFSISYDYGAAWPHH